MTDVEKMVKSIRQDNPDISDWDLKLTMGTFGYAFSETAEFLKEEKKRNEANN